MESLVFFLYFLAFGTPALVILVVAIMTLFIKGFRNSRFLFLSSFILFGISFFMILLEKISDEKAKYDFKGDYNLINHSFEAQLHIKDNEFEINVNKDTIITGSWSYYYEEDAFLTYGDSCKIEIHPIDDDFVIIYSDVIYKGDSLKEIQFEKDSWLSF